MQNKSDDITASLRTNLKRIIQLYESQKEKNIILHQQNEDLNQKIGTLELKKNELIQKGNNTHLAQAFIEASGLCKF